ncbi:hypothetical protein FS837_003968, partial [Tulasnella sp. UAMH 9824]
MDSDQRSEALLGAGGFGVVYLATLDKSSEHPRKVAVKQLRIVQAIRGTPRIAFVGITIIRLARELKVWAKVKHPNILELIGYYISENYIDAQLVSEYMVNGNVMQYIKRGHVGADTRLKFVRDIATGLKYLHEFSPPICHGDLKPANVLVNESLDAVLSDFGVSSFINESGEPSGLTTSKSTKGALRYMSPELILQDQSKHTIESDVWAWGCTAFEVMTDSIPYSTSMKDAAIIMEVLKESAPGSIDALSTLILGTGVDSPCHTGVLSLRSIIPQCWDFDTTHRPPASKILQCIAIPSGEGLLNISQAEHASANQAAFTHQRKLSIFKRILSIGTLPLHFGVGGSSSGLRSSPPSNPLRRPVKRAFSWRGLWEGLFSTNSKRSETSDASDLTGKLINKTKSKESGDFSDIWKANHGSRPVAVEQLRSTEIDPFEEPRTRKPLERENVGARLDGTAAGGPKPPFVDPPNRSRPRAGPHTSAIGFSRQHDELPNGNSPHETPGQAPVPSVPSTRSRRGSVATQPDEAPKSHRSSSASTDPDKKSPLTTDELQGLSSASEELSERVKAWDRTSQLTERSTPRFTGRISDVSQAKLGDRAVAVKALRIGEIEGDESQIWKRLARQFDVAAALDHPNVLELLGLAVEDGIPCLISPWCDNGTLPEYLKKFPDANRRRLVREIAEGLRYLHLQKPPIIQGDLTT